MMRLTGELVSCAVYGFGQIIAQGSHDIHVLFFAQDQICRFSLPDCFVEELTLEDPLTNSAWKQDCTEQAEKADSTHNEDMF